MKKVLAIILSAALLITALAVNVVAASATGTATGTFSGTFTANDYDSGMSTVTGSDVDIDGTWGGQFPDITKIIEKVAPLEDVTHIKVTVTANDITPCRGGEGPSPRVELHWNNRADTNAMTATFETTSGTAGQAVVYGDVPTGTTAVVLNPFAFNDQAESPIEFSVTVEVTYEEQGKVRIGDEYFDTLVEAVDAAQSGDTIYLLDNLEGAGIGIFAADGDVKDFTIDFGGFTYTCVGPAVGSTGTQSQAFHLEKGADYTPNVTFKNGTITAETGVGVKMLIQNYCNLTLTNMNLIGTTDTQYVLSNNFGNTVIDGNTSITATAGNVAFDVCYANGSYKDGVSVTVNTTGTITGIIELGTWNAAGAATGAPNINDYLENANLTINNVKLDGEIRNVVTGTYEPDPEVYSGPTELGLFVSTDMYAAPDATVTVTEPGTYTISKDFGSDGVDYSWIVIKEANSRGWEVGSTTIPTGTKVNITNIKINNTDVTFPDSASQIEYTVGNENKIEYAYYNMYAGGTVSTKPTEGNITSISVTIEIVENKKSEEEIAAELKDKLTETVAINGGVFGAESNVEDYLPEGNYETDDDGNIVIGDVVDDEVDYSHIKLTGGCVYLNENYHAFIVNGRFIAQPHADNGSGFCTACKGVIVADTAE